MRKLLECVPRLFLEIVAPSLLLLVGLLIILAIVQFVVVLIGGR